MAEQKKKWRSKFFVRGLAVLFGLVLLIGSVVSSSIETRAASWVLRTITGTPGDVYPDHWGENGYSLVTHNGKSYLYIYGEHYRTDSSANPTVFKLHRWKWNDSLGVFQRYDVLTNSIYNNNPKRFFGFSSLNEWETGVYLFSHEAKVSGVTHEGEISQNITYSNWVTIGNGVNAKIALVYYDSINGDSKIRIRNAQARNKIQSISVDTTNGIVMDIRGAMVSTDNGYDVRQFEGGRLVKHADGEYHVVGDDDPAKTGSEISVKNPSGSVIYSTSSGSEYSLGSKEQPYRYGKRDMTIPVSTLKSMTTNGTYSIVYSINVDSGSYGTKSIASTNLNAPSTGYSKTIKLLANDGAYHNYRVFESGGALKIQVTDATPPTASTEQTPTAWTNGGVTLRVYNISDTGGSGYDYVVLPNGSTSTKTDVSYTVNTNGSYTFTIYDRQGNTTTKTFTVSNIDKTNPIVTFGTNGNSTYGKSHSTTVSVSDSQSGVASRKYAWSTSSSTPPTNWTDFSNGATITTPGGVTGTYYLWVQATDNAGNTNTVRSNAFMLDNTTGTVTASPTSGGWTTAPYQVTLSYSDTPSGVKLRQYQWSTSTATPSSWQNYSSTVTQPGTGTYYLHYRLEDQAGNVKTGYFGPYQYETTKPTADISYSPTGWTNGNVTITLNNISDSGGSGYDYTKKPDGSTTTSTSFNYSVSQNGTYSFTIYDKAGNSTVKSVTISNIDKAAPTFETSYSPTGWTNGNVTIVLKNINDTGGSGYDKTRLPDGTYTTNTNVSYTVSDNGSYQFTVYDKAGNSTTKTVIISNIDKVKPTAIVSYSTTLPTNGNVVVTVKAEDDRSGVESILLPDGTLVVGDQVSYTVSANGTYDFVVTDKAGNQTVVKAVVSNIDKTPPTLTLTANPTAWTNKPITITASASDAGGIDRIVLPDGTVVRQTTASITVTQNGTYTFEAYDKVGNRTVKSITISNYDGDRPSVNIKETGRSGSKIDVQLEYGD
ncbi:Ig-like domain repeat protein [Caldibacillus debilis]|uniref:Bacterial Ig-like domain (Group 3) n=1 Tax=Caldibacillus debilis GB1 TaxID=1339248 RepID=A0A420VE09_9BACI|nr:Ig-like domain repeat protein [Caldibacillus debilis]RKO61785.1 Bacterial Ig-like domain (group 3) [Caldibacillus debilis GB1]